MDFWGTWCPPCRESVPTLCKLSKKYAGKLFQLVSVSSDDDEDVWKTFLQAEHMDWSQYIDLPGKVLEAFKVESFPTFVVLDKYGVIRFRQSGEGPATESDLEDAINKYLKRESDPKLAAAADAGARSRPSAAPARSASPGRASSLVSRPPASSPVASLPANRIPAQGGDLPASLPGVEGEVVSSGVYKNQA
jgi:thiol-disulfide isomerase/thioredoxin